MKHHLLLIVLLISGIHGWSQDWSPFIEGASTYYLQETDEGIVIDRFEYHHLMFGSLNVVHPVPCEDWGYIILDEYQNGYGRFPWEYKPIATYLDQQNILLIFAPNHSGDDFLEFYFKPWMRPGETFDNWMATLKCTSEDTMTIFGEVDSIRLFNVLTPPYTTLEFVLSKSHGFVSFPPLQNFEVANPAEFIPDYTLVGQRDSLSSKGYSQPQFHDYFHLSPGDIRIWYDRSGGFVNDSVVHDTVYHVDTILDVTIGIDTIQYNISRGEYNAAGGFVGTTMHVEYYLKEREGRLLEGPIYWPVERLEPAMRANDYLHPIELLVEDQDTISVARISPSQVFLDGCTYSNGTGGTWLYFNTLVGLTRVWTNHQHHYHRRELVGSIIDGVATGIVEIPSSTVEPQYRQLSISPNPAQDYILVDDLICRRAEIFASDGRLVSVCGDLRNGRIDVSGLQTGAYFLKLWDEDGVISVARFVKQGL